MSIHAALDPDGVARIDPGAGFDLATLREEVDSLAFEGEARVVVLALDGAATAPAGIELATAVLPIVAALSGALGGPMLDLALECDIRVCDAATTFRFETFGTHRQLVLLGAARAVELFERGGELDAEDALALGLVSHVAPVGGALQEALRIGRVVASRGPIATRLGKEATWRGIEMPLEAALRFETDLTLLLQTTKDRAEGVAAFIEKRPPRFTGDTEP